MMEAIMKAQELQALLIEKERELEQIKNDSEALLIEKERELQQIKSTAEENLESAKRCNADSVTISENRNKMATEWQKIKDENKKLNGQLESSVADLAQEKVQAEVRREKIVEKIKLEINLVFSS